MSSICLIDTSIFLEILNVPNYNQHRALVLEVVLMFVVRPINILLCTWNSV